MIIYPKLANYEVKKSLASVLINLKIVILIIDIV